MAAADSITIKGQDQLAAALAQAGPLAMEALKSAMVQEQEQVMAEAKKLCPVDTGVLRASGTVLPPAETGMSAEVVAGFGGAASAYAVPVHERMGVHHPTGQAKFLEQPFLERLPMMGQNLAKRVASAMQQLRKGRV